MNITEKVIGIIKELSGKEEVNLSDNLQEDVALDSLAMVTLLVEIEEEFDIELDESDMNPFDLNTVEDTVNLVNKYGGDENEKKS